MNSLRCYKPVAVEASDEESLNLVAALMQDAVAKVGDFAYLPAERRFAFVANRFVWECAIDRDRGPFARVRTGVHFDDVLGVKTQSLRLDAKEAVVDLLAIRFDAAADGVGSVTLELAGGGGIRLEVESVNAALRDISDPWRTRSKPSHRETS